MYKKMELEQQDAVSTKSDRSALIQPDANRHGGRVDEVHFNTWKTAKGGQIQDHLVEAIQPIEKAGLEQQNTGLIHVKNLFPCLGFAPRSRRLA